MVKKLKELKFIDWILILIVGFIPSCVIFNIFKGLDNDLWYLLTEGRYIIQNGIYHIDTISLHEGLDIVVQNWLSAVIFWIVYAFLGYKGIFFMVLLVNFVICYLIYKICMLISNNRKILSVIITIFTDLNLSLYFIVSRPQIFSFVILLLLIYLLELYIKNDDNKYLKFIPLLSFLEINLHASLWWMIFLFMIPYIIDSFKSDKLMLQGYRTKPLIITFIVSFLVGFINPYGYKAILFIFNSYGDKYMFKYIYELQPFTFNNLISIHIFVVALITMLLSVYFRKGIVRVRYICLYCGTLIMGMITVKALSHFLLVATFPLALLLKDMFNSKIKSNKVKKFGYVLVTLFTISLVGFSGYSYYKMNKRIEFVHAAKDAVDSIDLFTNGYPAKVYVSFNDGGYVSFRGYKPYIDPRAEVYLKRNNHKKDIYKEYYEFETGQIDKDEFIKKYNFDFILLKAGDRLYAEDKIDNYFIIYDSIDYLYRVYARNDVTTDDIRNYIIEEYEKSKQNSKDNNNK